MHEHDEMCKIRNGHLDRARLKTNIEDSEYKLGQQARVQRNKVIMNVTTGHGRTEPLNGATDCLTAYAEPGRHLSPTSDTYNLYVRVCIY